MSIDELAEKIDSRFDKLDAKVDTINTTVAIHTTTLQTHDRENRGFKEAIAHLSERITKLEKWMWFTLGAGGAAGAGLAKLFM